MFSKFDIDCMKIALKEAQLAYNKGEVPIGAVLTLDKTVIAQSHNQVESLNDATSHAEMICLKEGSKKINNWRLCKTTLYVTVEPCAMCAGASILSRVNKIIYGCNEPRSGALGSWVNLFESKHPIHHVEFLSGLMELESRYLIQKFFKERRETCKQMKHCLKS